MRDGDWEVRDVIIWKEILAGAVIGARLCRAS